MQDFVAHQNIDHYLHLLQNGELPHAQQVMIRRMLVEEEDRLSRNQEQLEFVETRLAACEKRVSDLQHLRDSFPPDSAEREQADAVLATLEDTLRLVSQHCRQLRKEIARNMI